MKFQAQFVMIDLGRLMRKVALLALAMMSGVACAEDGLVIQFNIEEKSISSTATSKYINAGLMRLDETATFHFVNQYEIKVDSTRVSEGRVRLVITLKDLSEGKSYYVGAKPVELSVGESASLSFATTDSSYSLILDTAFGKIPVQ